MDNELMQLKELLSGEIKKIVKKGDLTPAELENATKAVCLIEKIKKLDSPEYEQGYAEGYSEGYNQSNNNSYDYMHSEGSYARGRSPVTGRYISRGMDNGGYSGHSVEDRQIAALEQMIDSAKSEYERNSIQNTINDIRRRTR